MKRVYGDWTTLFSAEIRRRGKEYYDSGKTKKIMSEDYGYSMTVRGSRNYHVEIYLDGEEKLEDITCTCPYAAEGRYCKHMAAALYELEDYLGEAIDLSDGEEDGTPHSFETKTAQEDGKSEKEPAEQVESKKEPVKQAAEEVFSELATIQKETRKDREETPEEMPFEGSDYRYFQYQNYAGDLKLNADLLRKADKLLEKMKNPNLILKLGYDQSGNQEGMIGSATLSDQANEYVYAEWKATIVFGRDHLISSNCSNWRCNPGLYYKVKNIPCVHQVAALKLLEKRLKEENPGDSTSYEARTFLGSFGGGISTQEEEIPATLQMEPYLVYEDQTLTVLFRVGNIGAKLYKITDLRKFASEAQKGGEMTFGSKTTLTLRREYIREQDRKWFSFIEDELASEDTTLNRYHFRYANRNFYYPEPSRIKDKIELEGGKLDRFFDLALEESIETTMKSYRGEKTKTFWHFQNAEFPVTLVIRQDTDPDTGICHGLTVTGNLPKLMDGIRSKYYVSDDGLNRISEERTRALKPLLSAERLGVIRLSIGRDNLGEFYHRVLPALKEIAHVVISDEDAEVLSRLLPPEPEFVTYLDVDSGNVIGRADVFYGSRCFAVTDWVSSRRGSIESYRDRKRENELLNTLGRYLPQYDEQLNILFCSKDDEKLFDFLDRGVPELMRLGEVRSTNAFKNLRIRNRAKFDIGLSVESNLLDIDIRSTDLSPEELLDILFSYQKKKKFVRLKNGDFFRLDDNDTIARLTEMMEALHVSPKEFVSGKMHIPAYRALYLDHMMESSQDLYTTRDKRFKSLIKEFKTVEDADFDVPASLKETLRKYQQTGYRWLRTLDAHGFGGILADDMGLGKTLQVIAVLLAVKEEAESLKEEAEAAKGKNKASKDKAAAEAAVSRPSLVVCPASLVFNWGEELRRFAPSLSVSLIAGGKKEREAKIDAWQDVDVLVTSYDLLKRDIAEYEDKHFRFVIADEAQYVKNQSTAAAKSLKLVQADTHFALTGTPIENRLSELWSIFDFLMPGMLYSYDEFRTTIEAPLLKGGNDAVSDRLRRMVTPFILRRKKTEVLEELPEKLEEIRYAKMETKQRRLYDGQVVRMKKKLNSTSEADFRKGKIEILAELMHIRQICCDPSLMFADYDGESAKREMCMDLITSLIEGEHRMLVFSQFTTMLEKLEEDLSSRGIAYYKITGATPKEKRVQMVNAFNEGDVPVFLISLKAGGTGLNLTGADAVIHYDPWWNLAVQNQATDRAHRIGQTKVVNVYKLIVKDTIEERIVEMQENKRKLADDILSAEGISSAAISKEDLMELLG
ncbi:MAG: SNF2 helicase associated domain-containing protein [Lachnospiraceae bacterium]|nr:SNF2 helicase associated domain-containing protein [Lachnospiraceae bacterium]